MLEKLQNAGMLALGALWARSHDSPRIKPIVFGLAKALKESGVNSTYVDELVKEGETENEKPGNSNGSPGDPTWSD